MIRTDWTPVHYSHTSSRYLSDNVKCLQSLANHYKTHQIYSQSTYNITAIHFETNRICNDS